MGTQYAKLASEMLRAVLENDFHQDSVVSISRMSGSYKTLIKIDPKNV